MDKSTISISMAIFNSYVCLPEGIWKSKSHEKSPLVLYQQHPIHIALNPIQIPFSFHDKSYKSNIVDG